MISFWIHLVLHGYLVICQGVCVNSKCRLQISLLLGKVQMPACYSWQPIYTAFLFQVTLPNVCASYEASNTMCLNQRSIHASSLEYKLISQYKIVGGSKLYLICRFASVSHLEHTYKPNLTQNIIGLSLHLTIHHIHLTQSTRIKVRSNSPSLNRLQKPYM